MNHIIEEERGTYTGSWHRHNGYYAGDFSDRPVQPLDLRTFDLTAGVRS
jgi:hypothetical protein